MKRTGGNMSGSAVPLLLSRYRTCGTLINRSREGVDRDNVPNMIVRQAKFIQSLFQIAA